MRTAQSETKPFTVEKGVRQGCILSPVLINIYAENIMKLIENIKKASEKSGLYLNVEKTYIMSNQPI